MAFIPDKYPGLPVLFALLVASPPVAALRLEPTVGVGLRYTDNATLAPSDKMDDWIVGTDLGLLASESSGTWQASANLLWKHQKYLNDSYGNKDYIDLSAVSDWEQIEDRLSWNIQDYFTQTSVENLDPDTPDNRENINVFSFGPNINIPLSARHTINLNPYYRDYYYQDSDIDNYQTGISALWLYRIYPTMQVGLNGIVNDVVYDDDDLNPNYTSTTISAVATGATARSAYRISAGRTDINRDRYGDISGTVGSMSWEFDLSGRSRLLSLISSELTNSSEIVYTSSADPDFGDPGNVQNSGSVLRDNKLRLEYSRLGNTVTTRTWIELRDLDYKESLNDREVQDYGADLSYRLSGLVTTGINGRYIRTESTDINRTDKEYFVGTNLRYNMSRKLQGTLNLYYQDKNSTQSVNEYSEFSVFAGLEYAFGGRALEY